MEAKVAFITGGSGFIGRELIRRLREQRWVVRCLVHRKALTAYDADVLSVPIGLFDCDGLAHAMKGSDVLFHLAGAVSFREADREKLLKVNAQGTLSVLLAAEKAGVGRAVVTSSAITLGLQATPLTVDESQLYDAQLRKNNCYMDSKAEQESIARSLCSQNLEIVTVNPSTVFGPGDHSLNSGSLIRMVLHGKALLVPPGGTSVVDVRDVARGLMAAATQGRSGERYVLTAQNLTFLELYRRIARGLHRSPLLIRLPASSRPFVVAAARSLEWIKQRKGDAETLITSQNVAATFRFKYYSPAKAEHELGWQPHYTLEESVAAAYEYYKAGGLM